MFIKTHRSLIAILMILAFVIAGCGGSPAQAPKEPPKAAAPAVDAVAATKEAAWDGYKKMIAENTAKTFPLGADKVLEVTKGNEAKYLFIDMRAPEDYAKGHVKGAVNLPAGKMAENLARLPKDKTLVVYCYSGQNSGLAMVPLKAYGYKAISVSKGYPEIEKAGFATDTAAVEFKAAEAKPSADPKVAAAEKGIQEAFDALAKQAAGKTLIVAADEVNKVVSASPDKHIIVDLRLAEDYAKGHIKGSVNIPLAQLSDKVGTLAKDKTLVLYCYSGQTAAMATVPLKVEGFKLMSISTGYPAAEKGGFAIE